MNLIFYGLAAIGGLLMILGRRMIIEDARGFSEGWAWAIRLLPLADMMYLARFWESAKTGAFMSIAGLVLIMPAGGKALWDKKYPPVVEQKKGAKLGLLDADQRNSMFEAMKSEHEERIARKQQKLETLNARLAGWYQSMESRRPVLANAAPPDIAAFNNEASAYSTLRAIGKTETEELVKLQAKQYTGWGSIPDSEYREYQERTEREAKKSTKEQLARKMGGDGDGE